MLTNRRWLPSSSLAFWISVGGVVVGTAAGVLAGANPLYLGLILGTVIVFVYFFADFERAVLGLLILRSSLDIFSEQGVPAAFAIGVDALTLLYVVLRLLTGQRVKTDQFWWFFAGWVGLQGLWVILLPLGGLGFDASYLPVSIREWARIFSWLMVYLLVMQLKDRIPPMRVVNALFLSLVLPLIAALLQVILPPSLLPSFLAYRAIAFTNIEGASRINGTLGHSNTFATFLLLFIGLTYWQLGQAKQRWPWLLLLGALTFFLASTKALVATIMIAAFVLALIIPRLTPLRLIGGILLVAVVVGFFASTEFGRERLAEISYTPLLNPDLDLSRAILLYNSVEEYRNSFNWRLAAWTSLLQSWRHFPILGYGLGTTTYVGYIRAYAHNDYVRALVEGGIVGFIMFLLFLGTHFSRLTRLFLSMPEGSSLKSLCSVLLAVLLALAIGMSSENIWSHTTLFFYWSALNAVVGWNWNQTQTPKNTGASESELSCCPNLMSTPI